MIIKIPATSKNHSQVASAQKRARDEHHPSPMYLKTPYSKISLGIHNSTPLKVEYRLSITMNRYGDSDVFACLRKPYAHPRPDLFRSLKHLISSSVFQAECEAIMHAGRIFSLPSSLGAQIAQLRRNRLINPFERAIF